MRVSNTVSLPSAFLSVTLFITSLIVIVTIHRRLGLSCSAVKADATDDVERTEVGTDASKRWASHSSWLDVREAKDFNRAAAVLKTNLASLTPAQLEVMYFGILEQQHVRCPYSIRIGNSDDGGWDVCFIRPFNITESKPCVAFSLGIDNAWEYDDTLAEKYHCNVYMFDPSKVNVNDHQRKKTSRFYRIGISSETKVDSNGWKMRTLCTLFYELGYENKKIDILKIDVEHWEWASFEKAFNEGCLKNVKQLIFKSRTSELVKKKSDYARLIRIWRGLFKLGFRTWKWHKNPLSVFFPSVASLKVQRTCCYEHYMINTNH